MNEPIITGLAGAVLSLLLLWVGFSLRRMMNTQDERDETRQSQFTQLSLDIKEEFRQSRVEIGKVHARLDEEAERRHTCQLSNASTYATKTEVGKLEKKVDATKEKVIRLEERTNG
ncbi:hypothetical protein [Halodesulfovibrio sp.]|jgi:hypothetical protein|uniref:hypothetical protein n=1 Tax=Halodesulfovibrio sp. TaxID=1912772 RepID=UPI0025E00F5D|nr:hypothetical protein [Halodesulfovibrio sp.]MCT4627949.1 hypothetical protein [Halodesulfovibrio sp.]